MNHPSVVHDVQRPSSVPPTDPAGVQCLSGLGGDDVASYQNRPVQLPSVDGGLVDDRSCDRPKSQVGQSETFENHAEVDPRIGRMPWDGVHEDTNCTAFG